MDLQDLIKSKAVTGADKAGKEAKTKGKDKKKGKSKKSKKQTSEPAISRPAKVDISNFDSFNISGLYHLPLGVPAAVLVCPIQFMLREI